MGHIFKSKLVGFPDQSLKADQKSYLERWQMHGKAYVVKKGAYLGHYQTSVMKLFAKIVNDF